MRFAIVSQPSHLPLKAQSNHYFVVVPCMVNRQNRVLGIRLTYFDFAGGANEAVIRMLISIGSPDNVPAFVEAVKRREKVLPGFGHR